ncbi:hypothetical protein ACWKW6_20335 [Dyadobacter jiangsuensis]
MISGILTKVERILGQKQAHPGLTAQASQPQSELAAFIKVVRENSQTLAQIIYAAPPADQGLTSIKIDSRSWRRFSNILGRVARGKDGISRQEHLFVRQFWDQLQKL